jgi:hypothetical protein
MMIGFAFIELVRFTADAALLLLPLMMMMENLLLLVGP